MSCFAQYVGLQVEKQYGKSWNVHVVGPSANHIKGAQYSQDRWMSFAKAGKPTYSYYIIKPVDCSRPFTLTSNFQK